MCVLLLCVKSFEASAHGSYRLVRIKRVCTALEDKCDGVRSDTDCMH